jgi:hypothetical protein
MLDTY